MTAKKINETSNVYTDCIHFPLDKPCANQKQFSIKCAGCRQYQKMSAKTDKTRILIIKLGAMGDVLRSVFLLEGLKEKYPSSVITWIVYPKNAAVLEGNPYIDKIVYCDEKINSFLINNFFDIALNLDLSHDSLALSKLAFASKILGYCLDENRNITTSNLYALNWLYMSADDSLKKANDKTYQYYMSKIAEILSDKYEIIVPLRQDMKEKASNFLKEICADSGKKIIGINPGAGKRWALKKWNIKKFIETAEYFSNKGHIVLLLGGKDDAEEIETIMKAGIKNVFSGGTDNEIAYFFALINLCDIVLCGDTMAMHAAAGLKKKVAAIFGPTSYNEIELYGRGVKIISDIDCRICYLQHCPKTTTCMDLIETKTVISAIEKLLQE